MSLDPIGVYASYSAAWNERDDLAGRRTLLDTAWSENGAFFDEETPDGLFGREALSAYISETHQEMPELVVTETSEPQILGSRLRVRWVAHQADEQMFTGTDFIEFAEDGRISRVTMFYDSTPDLA